MLRPDILILDPGNYTPYYDINLGEALSKRGWNVEWVTSVYLFEPLTIPPDLNVDNLFFRALSIWMTRLPKIRYLTGVRQFAKALLYPFDLVRLDRKLAARQPGILHVQWALLPALDVIFWRRWQARGWKIIYTAHDVAGLAGTTPRILWNSNRRLFLTADQLITHNERDRRKIIELGRAPTRIEHIPQGGPGLFQTQGLTREQVRGEMGIELDRPVILFFGLLKPYKGLHILISSLARIREAVPNVLLLIVGESMIPRDRFSRLIRQNCLQHHVQWQAQYIPHGHVSRFLTATNVVALPYLSASSSAVLINAYSHARPVVATRVGGLPEMVIHSRTGLIVPPANPTALAEALCEILRDPARADAMGAYARDQALANNSWERIAGMTENLYDRA
jgi:glycosyltransferase involved in cell wall biosynthesis